MENIRFNQSIALMRNLGLSNLTTTRIGTMAKVYIIIGSNLGDKAENLNSARNAIYSLAGKRLTESSIFETEPWGFLHPDFFLNQVIVIETLLMPDELLRKLLEIEKKMGRKRKSQSYEARIVDIDILFFDEEIIRQEDIVVPHPRLHLRRFALIPLNEIAPNLVHPVLKRSIKQLLDECLDKGKVSKYMQ